MFQLLLLSKLLFGISALLILRPVQNYFLYLRTLPCSAILSFSVVFSIYFVWLFICHALFLIIRSVQSLPSLLNFYNILLKYLTLKAKRTRLIWISKKFSSFGFTLHFIGNRKNQIRSIPFQGLSLPLHRSLKVPTWIFYCFLFL